MEEKASAPVLLVGNLHGPFFRARGLTPAPRSLKGELSAPSGDRITSDLEQFGYTRLDALREAPRGRRDWVVVLFLAKEGRYAQRCPQLRNLISGVCAERPARDGRLDEVIVVADRPFFTKSNRVAMMAEFRDANVVEPDNEGAAPSFNAYPYHTFSADMPRQPAVIPHFRLSPEAGRAVLESWHGAPGDFPTVFSCDTPVVWAGGRPGDVFEIHRPSQTAGLALYYRRVVKKDYERLAQSRKAGPDDEKDDDDDAV